MRSFVFTCACIGILAGGTSMAFGDDEGPDLKTLNLPPNSSAPQGGGGGSSSGLPRFGVAVKVGFLLGIGVEAATSVTRKSNVRGGFNMFSFDYDTDRNNTHYGAKLRMQSAQATFDWFPFGGGFHLSPGAILYNRNRIEADLTVPGGKTITLNNTTYISKTTDPLLGSLNMDLRQRDVAPMFLLGWGNLLKRKSGHFSVNFEFGAAYTGAPKSTLSFQGTACTNVQQTTCFPAGTALNVLSDISGQQAKIDRDIKFAQITPIISTSFGWKF